MDKEELTEKVKEQWLEVKDLIFGMKFDINKPEHKKLWEEMVDNAFALSKIVNPKHHKYMIKNRGVSEKTREFYNHFHSVEDLLKYIDDPHANDDPEDQTIEHDFEMEIYSQRWGHIDKYQIKRTSKGWIIGNISIAGECDKKGYPYLYKNLRQDSVNYPNSLPEYLEYLWDQAAEKGLSHEEVQEALNNLAKWINTCEKSSPKGVWDGF